VILRRERLGKFVAHQVATNKKSVYADKIAADKAVTELTREQLECLQARPEIDCSIPGARAIVMNLPIDLLWDDGVVFDYDDTWPKFPQAFPRVIRVLIDVQGKEIEFPRHS